MSKKVKYNLEIINGDKRLVHKLPNGNYVVDASYGDYLEFRVYNSKHQFLGWTNYEEQAEYLASTGFVNHFESVSEDSMLDAWVLLAKQGATVYEDDEGWQYITLAGGVNFLGLKNENGSYETEIFTEKEMLKRFSDAKFENVITLRLAERVYLMK